MARHRAPVPTGGVAVGTGAAQVRRRARLCPPYEAPLDQFDWDML